MAAPGYTTWSPGPVESPGRILLLGGPAGAGKSTLAEAWCATRRVAAHLQVDGVRDLIVQGRVDPLDTTHADQPSQWASAVRVTCAMARAFAADGVDVAIDDLMLPQDVEGFWRPLLADTDARLVIVLPRLSVTLDRGRKRSKAVPSDIVTQQHAASSAWPAARLLDTSDLGVEQSLALLAQRLLSGDSAL